ncbi:MAG: hypothetical protein IPM37_12380 [Hahellaceae bacterium]|nr:hypothetical protein [Hahellaceae bacterium]
MSGNNPGKLIASGLAITAICALIYFEQNNDRNNANSEVADPASSVSITTMEKPAKPFPHQNTIAASPTTTKTDNMLSIEEILRLPDTNPDYATFGDRVSEINARRNGQETDVTALHKAAQQASAWQPADTVSDQFPLSDDERMDGREFIKVDQLKIESLVAGDTLEINIAQTNGMYVARIDRVESQFGNNVSWFGHLEDVAGTEGDITNVTFTRGETLMTAGITTPDGHFEIEARGNEGWISKSANLYKHEDTVINVPIDELAKTPAVSSEALTQKKEGVLFSNRN